MSKQFLIFALLHFVPGIVGSSMSQQINHQMCKDLDISASSKNRGSILVAIRNSSSMNSYTQSIVISWRGLQNGSKTFSVILNPTDSFSYAIQKLSPATYTVTVNIGGVCKKVIDNIKVA